MFDESFELYFDPRGELDKKGMNVSQIEMTQYQSAFLCGLIRKYEPQKIVEVGIAAGGTTALILQCVEMLEIESEIYSVDISNKYYRDEDKATGYLAADVKKNLCENIKHEFLLGKSLPEVLECIGEDIDFLILDTVHSIPGEILDFIAALPYLKSNAIVILHDVQLHHLGAAKNKNAYATQVLLNTVVGRKYYGNEYLIDNGFGVKSTLSNIGAFSIIEDTTKYIENVFSSLFLTWNYHLSNEEIKKYRDLYTKFYDSQCLALFDSAVSINRMTLYNTGKILVDTSKIVNDFMEYIKKKSYIYLYGTGKWGKEFFVFLERMTIKIDGFIVSDGYKDRQDELYLGIPVYFLQEIPQNEIQETGIILTMNMETHKTVAKNLWSNGFSSWFPSDIGFAELKSFIEKENMTFAENSK